MHLSILGGILNATAIVALAVLLYVVSASYVIVSEDEHLHKEKVRKYAMSRGIEIMKLKDFCI